MFGNVKKVNELYGGIISRVILIFPDIISS